MSARTLRQTALVFSRQLRLGLSACANSSDASSVKSSSEPPPPKTSECQQKPEEDCEHQRCDPTKYNAEQLFQYTPWSFYDTELEMSVMRLPRQSSIKSKVSNKQ